VFERLFIVAALSSQTLFQRRWLPRVATAENSSKT
jgi:hypothetical protein